MKIIAGPCALEGYGHAKMMSEELMNLCHRHEFYYKSSFDKANRTKLDSPRGVGVDRAVEVFSKIEVPVLTDVHECWQCSELSGVVDIFQIPAFLCRQTDLIIEASRHLPINIKKGQFMRPEDMEWQVKKSLNETWLTERGSSFGYGLVVDMRSIPIMQEYADVIFDVTHSTERRFQWQLAEAALAAGADGLFVEVHQDPENAPSDGQRMMPLEEFREFVEILG